MWRGRAPAGLYYQSMVPWLAHVDHCRRLAQIQAEALSLRRTVERFLRSSYASSVVAQERAQLLGGAATAVSAAVLCSARPVD